MAAVVGAQRDRVAWLLFISNGSWLEYILPCRSTPPYSTPFSGASSWRYALEKRAETREQEARTWRIFYGKNGGSHPHSHSWTSCGDESWLELGICVTEMHKISKWMLRGIILRMGSSLHISLPLFLENSNVRNQIKNAQKYLRNVKIII